MRGKYSLETIIKEGGDFHSIPRKDAVTELGRQSTDFMKKNHIGEIIDLTLLIGICGIKEVFQSFKKHDGHPLGSFAQLRPGFDFTTKDEFLDLEGNDFAIT